MAESKHTNGTEFDTEKEVLERLRSTLDNIEAVRKIIRSPSISFGVLYQGRIIFTDSVGSINDNVKPDADTLYHLGSVSKCFISALVGIAVEEGKLGWKDLISTHLPEFNPVDDPEMAGQVRILDCLRHSSGVGSTGTTLVLGPRGNLINKEEDFLTLLNHSPTKNKKGDTRYNTWEYSNWGYSLVAMCLQKVYGIRYNVLLQTRILDPLKMGRTVLRQSDAEKDTNSSHCHATLSDEKCVRIPCGMTTEDHTPMLSICGMRSSVKDMLTWAKAVMETEKVERETSEEKQPVYPSGNPLRSITTTRGKAYWTRPNHDKFKNEIWYCLGWLRVVMPTSGLSCLGANLRPRDDPIPEKWIIGAESPQTEVILHNGAALGSTCAFYTFPETQSAIITYCNAIQNGCGADVTAQILAQALLGSKPYVDMVEFTKKEARERWSKRPAETLQKWTDNRNVPKEEAPKSDYVGPYKGIGGAIIVSIKLDEGLNSLIVTFGDKETTTMALELYGTDSYSAWSKNRDERLSASLNFWESNVGILKFLRNDDGEVDRLSWEYSSEDHPAILQKAEALRGLVVS